MFKISHKHILFWLLLGVLFVAALMPVPVMANTGSSPNTTVASSQWCGRLSSYTTWYYSGVEHMWKPILYVWKGQGRGNPYWVNVAFNNQIVPDRDDAVKTTPGPQVDLNNGWVGYFIARRFYYFNWQWDDDWRWRVNACLP
jgi:hypothetical protein